MKILVCGGAGYIGAHMVRRLQVEDCEVVVFDDFSTGHRAAVEGVCVVEGTLLSEHDIERAFANGGFDAAMHFCAHALVAESVRDPYAYYRNNLVGTLNLLSALRRHSVNRLIFSSTCAIFGVPQTARIDEAHPKAPINPYGASKWMCERMLADAWPAYGLKSVALRYFNAAGAALDGRIGESHSPETHLIPNVLNTALGKLPVIKVFGRDYPTPDGTCVRDYVHVLDLVDAHWRALALIDQSPGAHAFNLGSERGFSVREIIEAAETICGRKILQESCPRRDGDPPELVADSTRARSVLGWAPQMSGLDTILKSALAWHRAPRF